MTDEIYNQTDYTGENYRVEEEVDDRPIPKHFPPQYFPPQPYKHGHHQSPFHQPPQPFPYPPQHQFGKSPSWAMGMNYPTPYPMTFPMNYPMSFMYARDFYDWDYFY